MKTKTGMVKFIGALGLVLGSLGSLAAEQALDVLTLKDGRVVQGEIVGERASQVEIVVGGVNRTYSRDFISKISYGSLADDPSGDGALAANVPAGPGGDAFTADLAARYQVPQSSVVWVRQQGISDFDVPKVLELAAEARVPLHAVVDLRLQGWSWHAIRVHYGLSEPEPQVVVVAPVVVPPPLFLRILLFPFFIFGHWR